MTVSIVDEAADLALDTPIQNEAANDDNRTTWEYLSNLVARFDSKVAIVGNCWVWLPEKMKVAHRTKEGKLTNTRIFRLSYNHAYPDVPVRSGQQLKWVCGEERCFNPDHLTNPMWGLIEDLDWLLRTSKTPGLIPERLGMTTEELVEKANSTHNKTLAGLVVEWQRRMVDDPVSETPYRWTRKLNGYDPGYIGRDEAMNILAKASTYLEGREVNPANAYKGKRRGK